MISEDFYTDDSSITYNLLAEYVANFQGILERKTPFKNDDEYFYDELFDSEFPARLKWVVGFVCYKQSLFSLEYQANKLLLHPLEIMIEIVDTVAQDPMNAKNLENLQSGIKATINSKIKKEKDEENYESEVVKTAIIKISAILAIGFGEAGSEIIKKNLSNFQELNTKLKGKNKQAIFGFCDIRQFEDITLALEENIIHFIFDRFGGATNKNIGEALFECMVLKRIIEK